MAAVIEKTHDKTEENGKLPNGNGEVIDETDLAANRDSIPCEEQAENRKVHCFWDVFALGSILTFAADIGSDMLVAALYYQKGELSWFGLTLGFVLLSSVTMQVFSAKWFYDDQNNQHCHWSSYLLHALQLGPLLRYWNVSRTGWRTRRKTVSRSEYHNFLSEWRDICMLRLFEAYLESAPQLVLQLYILAYSRRFDVNSDMLTATAAACSLVSLAWAIVAYTKSLRDLRSDKVSWVGFFFQIMWRLLMVASRIIAMVLFASYYGVWLFVAIGLHWLVMFMFLVTQSSTFCMDNMGNEQPFREVFFNVVIAFIYIFSFFNIKEGMTRLRLLPYYTLVLVESSIFVVLWYPYRSLFGNVAIPAISIVWGGFLLALISMFLYYRFYHPNVEEKGLCYKRQEGFDIEGNYAYTLLWCCCCDVRAITRANATFRTAVVCRQPHPSASLTLKTNQTQNLPQALVMDLEIIPRSPSVELAPRLVPTQAAAYLKCQGRAEVIMKSPPNTALKPSPSQWI